MAGIPSSEELLRLQLGNAVLVEEINFSTANAYSVNVFNSGQLLLLHNRDSTDNAYVKFVREYVYGGRFGDNRYEQAASIWSIDPDTRVEADGDTLNPNTPFKTDLITTNQPTLTLTDALAGTRSMLYKMDDQDDVLRVLVGGRPLLYEGKVKQRRIAENLGLQFEMRHKEQIRITAGTNDKLDFTDGTAAKTATLTAGTYTRAGLATEIQTQMNAVATTNTYAVDFGTTALDKFSLVRATGLGAFSLNWATGANSASSVGATIGFDTSADDTGLTTYSADFTRAIADGMQYQVQYDRDGTTRYWNGTAWTNTATWVDVTGVEADTTFTDAVTSEDEAVYELRIRPKSDMVNFESIIDSIGLYETQDDKEGPHIKAGDGMFMAPPFRCRVAVDAAGPGFLQISDMRMY